MNININELSQQFQGATLPSLVEKHVRTHDEDLLLNAIRQTFDEFPPQMRSTINSYTEEYVTEWWFNEKAMSLDLGALLLGTIVDLMEWANENDHTFSEKELFDIFNIMVMKVARFAHESKSFRKALGVKKGVFS